MQASIQYIKAELAGFYPHTEVKAFIRLILESVLNLSYTDLIIQNSRCLDAAQKTRVEEIVERLKKKEPIQYILGECEFYGLRFRVNPAVLIPRPETEELVHWVLNSNLKSGVKILDIGSGSGCIPLALKQQLPGATISSIDISDAALETATQNAQNLALEVDFYSADILNWQNETWGKYDVVVSNPPYVRESEKKMMDENVLHYEPEGALYVEDDDPLIFYRSIAEFAQCYLSEGGYLFFEINEYLGNEMILLLKSLKFSDIELHKDLNGRNRMLKCKKSLQNSC